MSENEHITYCNYITAEADAGAATLIFPRVVSSAGLINNYDVAPSADVSLQRRVVVGLGVSAESLIRGLMRRQHAQALCQTYRTALDLRTFLNRTQASVVRVGAEAKLALLEPALQAQDTAIAQVRKQMLVHSATLADVEAMAAHQQRLQQEVVDTTEAMLVAESPWWPPTPVAELLRRHADADALAQSYVRYTHPAKAWDLQLRAGYDHVFGDAVPRQPLFASVNAEISLGLPWRISADRRAEQARRAWFDKQSDGLTVQVEEHIRKLRVVRDAARQRLRTQQGRLSAIQEQQGLLQGLPYEVTVRRLAESLRFDATWVAADVASDQARMAYIDTLLRDLS
jgi:hypothetical protein